MNTKQKIMLFAFVAMFSGAMLAHAVADDKAVSEKPSAAMEKNDQPKQEKKKGNRHSHPVDKGVMPPSSSDTKEEHMEPKKPMHDHKKEMKGG